MSEICKTCHSFKVFGEKCWFYWERKKACSQYRHTPEDEPHFFSIELLPAEPEQQQSAQDQK